MLYLYVEAPFAACRTFTAGWYRPTATFLTPSAAYGLLLNVAGIDSRLREEEDNHDGKTPASYLKRGLHTCKVALGVPNDCFPGLQSVYQQLHNYMVGGKEKVSDPENAGKKITKEESGLRRTKLAKWNITPVRREFLSDLKAVVALDGSSDLENAVRRGLCGDGPADRYGVPFLGDNSFLLDRLEVISWPDGRFRTVHWYERIGSETTTARPRATRLTYLIDRADLSKTKSDLYAPTIEPMAGDKPPPDTAWTAIDPPPLEPPPPPKQGRSNA